MNVGQCTDTQRLQHIQLYKRTVASRYRAVRHDELEHLPPGQLYVSPKVDGELWCVSVSGGTATLIAPNGRELTDGAPVLAELQTSVASRSDNCLIAGELFALERCHLLFADWEASARTAGERAGLGIALAFDTETKCTIR